MKKLLIALLLTSPLAACFDASQVSHDYRTLDPQEAARYKRHGSLAQTLAPNHADEDGTGIVVFSTKK